MVCFIDLYNWILDKKNKEIEAQLEKSFPPYVYPVHINILLKEDKSVLQPTSIDDGMTIYKTQPDKYPIIEGEIKRYNEWTEKYLNDWLFEQLPPLIDMHQILLTIAKEVSLKGISPATHQTFKVPLLNKSWKPLNRVLIKQLNIINKKMTKLGYTYYEMPAWLPVEKFNMSKVMEQIITSVVDSSNANGQLKNYKFITDVIYRNFENEYQYIYGGFKVKALPE